MRYVLCMIALLWSGFAQAQEVRQAVGLFCDKAEQVEQFVSLVKAGKSVPEAVEEVNKAAGNEMACGALRAMVVVLDMQKKEDYVLVHVMIVGVAVPTGMVQVSPTEQFFAMELAVRPAVNI